ncbi:polygalacturonase [Fragilaria crotonensis]|nr:polygalacturonase [Fragilaria crotonensis]
MFLQSPRVMSSCSGRAFSVVGGRDISMIDLYAEDTDAAALYIAAEPSIDSYGVSNVKVNRGVFIRSNKNQAINHGSILVYNGQPDEVVESITINNIRSEYTTSSQPWEMGIIMSGSGGVRRMNCEISSRSEVHRRPYTLKVRCQRIGRNELFKTDESYQITLDTQSIGPVLRGMHQLQRLSFKL